MNCIICAIAKMENDYIYEWAKYHLDMGFKCIHIFDNNDVAGERISDVFAGTELEKYIVVHDVRGLHCMQLKVYQNCYSNENFDWCAFIDVDEFITFYDNGKLSDIEAFLSDKKGFDAVHLNWLCYGDGGKEKKEPGLVVDRFKSPTKPIDFKAEYFDRTENSHIKSIIKKGCDIDWLNDKVWEVGCNPHTPFGLKKICDDKGQLVSNSPWKKESYERVYIRHYITMSLEEFARKEGRKAADIGETSRYKPYKFFLYNPISLQRLREVKRVFGYLPLMKIIQTKLLWWSVTNNLPFSLMFGSYRKYLRNKRASS